MDAPAFSELRARLLSFMSKEVYPLEPRFARECREVSEAGNEWTDPPSLRELTQKARAAGLWNLWLPNDVARAAALGDGCQGAGLTTLQYVELLEIMGTSNHMELAAQAMNCASPDTGNMETLARFGNTAQKERWLRPLLDGRIRSCYAMTEPAVASSDASNVETEIRRDPARGEYVVNGRKWWITGAGSLHCQVMILMGKTDPSAPRHRQQTTVLIPMSAPGITLLRPMTVLGDDDAPKGHMEVLLEDVRVPFADVLAGEGRGFEIAQARLGPGRLHHCARLLGTAERAISLLCRRSESRVAFGRKLSEYDTILQDIARSRNEVDMARLLLRAAAGRLDREGSKAARKELSMVKAVVPLTVQAVVDRAMQAHGAMGLSQDTFLATALNWARWLRYADGPDEVHWRVVAKVELKEQRDSPLHRLGHYAPPRLAPFRRSTDPISAAARARL